MYLQERAISTTRPARFHHGMAVTVGLFCLALLGGCQTQLFSGLDEEEAANMMAVLLSNGIACEKAPDPDGAWLLSVGRGDIPRSVQLLQYAGYPQGAFASMGSLFEKKGLVSTPMEERTRYIYALSQELSRTLMLIEGVSRARVHLVLPENNPMLDHLPPSSASVFIKYRHGADIQHQVPLIKHLVLNSVEGLTLDKVSVALVPGPPLHMVGPDLVPVMGVLLERETVLRFWLWITMPATFFAALAAIFAFPGIQNAFKMYRQRRLAQA